MESAKERLRVLSIEKRILTQSLEEAEAERLEAESRLLRTARGAEAYEGKTCPTDVYFP